MLSTYVCGVASVLLAVVALIADGTQALPMPTTAEGGALLYLALAVTAGGFLAWDSGVARLGVDRAGLFAGLIPVSALLSAALVGTGIVTPVRLLGTGLVGLGVALAIAGKRTSGDEEPVVRDAELAGDIVPASEHRG